MGRKITFKMATAEGPTESVGEVALFYVGAYQHKFVIHDNILSHYASGYRVHTIGGVKVERMARISSYTRTTDREAAKITLERIIAKVGADKVLASLKAAPVLNP